MHRQRKFVRVAIAIFFLGFGCVSCFVAQRESKAEEVKSPAASLREIAGISPITLLVIHEVLETIEVTGDQREAIRKVLQARALLAPRRPLQERTEQQTEQLQKTMQQLAEILSESQLQRLWEITVQLAGASALREQEIADQLALTEEQRNKLQELGNLNRDKMQRLRSEGPRRPRQSPEKLEPIRKEFLEKSLEVLTADQRSQFEKMQGK
jgi:hypothetical protein